MIEETEARRRILEAVDPGPVETVPLGEATGRFSGREIFASVDLPRFDNSAMDGYAVRAADAGTGAFLRILEEQPAGTDRGLAVDPGGAVRIFTGAPLPAGADAVVMQEDVRADAASGRIEILDGVQPGENIRRRGSDVCAGQRLLDPGDRVNAVRIGLLASQGIVKVEVFAKPRIAVVTTGDELVPPGTERIEAGQIFNSNGPMLAALAAEFGGYPRQFHAIDEAESLRAVLAEALADADAVIVAGGVSVGDRDLVKAELRNLGVREEFWRVRVRPGKPFVFGMAGRVPVFGLPGNPVSAWMTFMLFVAPALCRMRGENRERLATGLPLPRIEALAAERFENTGDRPHYFRCRLESDGRVRRVGAQESHALHGLSRAGVLVRLEPGEVREPGDAIRGYRL